MAITVTATQGGATAAGMALRVYVITGALQAASQTGGAVNTSFGTNTNTWTLSITTSAGSNVYGAASASPSGLPLSGSNATVVDNVSDATNNQSYVTFHALNVTAGATTRGFTSSGSSASGSLALFEILQATALAEDASAPAVASTTAATTVTTASFTPPASSLLVAIVSSDGGSGVTTMSVSDTSGLTWTEKSKNNATNADYAGIWVADVPAAAAAAGAAVIALPSRTWLERFGPSAGRPQQKIATPVFIPLVTTFFFSDSDSSFSADGGESLGITAADSGAGHGTDAAETIAFAANDVSAAVDAGEAVASMDFDTGVALVSPAWLTRWGRQKFPKQIQVYQPPFTVPFTTPSDSDGCLGYDSGFTFISDPESCTGTDTGVLLFSQQDSCTGTEVELSAWPQAVETCRSTETWFWSGPLSDADTSPHASDREGPFPFSDTETGTGTDGHIIDVYTFQPLFRWDGGSFRVVIRHPLGHEMTLWQGLRVTKAALDLAAKVSGTVHVVSDSDACRADEREEPSLGVHLHARPALHIRVVVT